MGNFLFIRNIIKLKTFYLYSRIILNNKIKFDLIIFKRKDGKQFFIRNILKSKALFTLLHQLITFEH